MRILLLAAVIFPLVAGCAMQKQQPQHGAKYSTPADSKEARLEALKEKRMSGLLTREEYFTARDRILNEK